MNSNSTNAYLVEDKDLLEDLEKCLSGVEKTTVNSDEIHKSGLLALQIKSTLRSRKTMIDLDSSNRQFSKVIGAFALLQLIVALMQFGFDVSVSENRGTAILYGLSAIIFISYIIHTVNCNLGSNK